MAPSIPFRVWLMVAIVGAILQASLQAAEPVKPQRTELDPGRVYRFDPLVEKYEPVAAAAIKPDSIYRRYSTSLNRWVWSTADREKRLVYAMGPGSVQPMSRFDLSASAEERTRRLEAKAPDLARLYVAQGSKGALKLLPDGSWALHGVSEVPHVYDLESGQRWEWHGDRRAGVTHTGGNSWVWSNGGYVPVGMRQVVVADWCD